MSAKLSFFRRIESQSKKETIEKFKKNKLDYFEIIKGIRDDLKEYYIVAFHKFTFSFNKTLSNILDVKKKSTTKELIQHMKTFSSSNYGLSKKIKQREDDLLSEQDKKHFNELKEELIHLYHVRTYFVTLEKNIAKNGLVLKLDPYLDKIEEMEFSGRELEQEEIMSSVEQSVDFINQLLDTSEIKIGEEDTPVDGIIGAIKKALGHKEESITETKSFELPSINKETSNPEETKEISKEPSSSKASDKSSLDVPSAPLTSPEPSSSKASAKASLDVPSVPLTSPEPSSSKASDKSSLDVPSVPLTSPEPSSSKASNKSSLDVPSAPSLESEEETQSQPAITLTSEEKDSILKEVSSDEYNKSIKPIIDYMGNFSGSIEDAIEKLISEGYSQNSIDNALGHILNQLEKRV